MNTREFAEALRILIDQHIITREDARLLFYNMLLTHGIIRHSVASQRKEMK